MSSNDDDKDTDCQATELSVESVTREGDLITVDARESEASLEQAVTALREALGSGCRRLVITDAQPYVEPWYQTVEPWCSALATLGSNELTSLVVDTYFQPLTRQASVYCGDVTALFRSCPMLRFAYVIGCASLEELAHPRLEDLTLMGEPITVATLRAVLRGPSPNVSRLALGLAYEQSPAPGVDAALLDALGAHGLPKLTELHVASPEDAAALLDGLARSKVLSQLRVLSIQGDVFEDEERGLAILEEHRAALSKLERLYLPLEDVMGLGDEELAAMIPGLRGTDELEAFAPSRYRG
ncbi:MAG: hypothetical protein JWM74_6064 [Myxococcaceae bacterium]|nr:hypothetical protein [Myxococcaceae bacterium]